MRRVFGRDHSLRRMGSAVGPLDVDMHVELGPIRLQNPIIAASGTFGYGNEFGSIAPPAELGAVTVKSLAHFAHEGNAPLRTTEAPGGGMLNSVGLAGPGVASWITNQLPMLEGNDVVIIVSIWGRSVADYATAAAQLQPVASRIAAIEVNLSCPNMGGHEMFGQSVALTRDAIAACLGDVPLFAKLTAQVTNLVDIAGAAVDAGATGLTLINTMPGLVVDAAQRSTKLGAGGGGLSGTPLHAIALRAVRDVHAALPRVPIVGTGGVSRGEHAVAMLLAGASAVGVGTATFANPRATIKVREELAQWCGENQVRNVRELTGGLLWPK